jgi:futalosine hydrolase
MSAQRSDGRDVEHRTSECRRVVLLTATEAEARPLLEALPDAERSVVATKAVYLGELHPGRVPVALAIGGCDKTNTAHVLTCVLQSLCPAPALVVQTGIAGAFARLDEAPATDAHVGAPGVGDLVLATQEAYSDTGSSSAGDWLSAAELGLPIALVNGCETGGVFALDEHLVERARDAILACDWSEAPPAVCMGPCVTSSCVTGTREQAEALVRRWSPLAESMEGAAAAHICALYGVPFVEIRGISNLVGDRDRSSWQVERAIRAAGKAALAVVAALGAVLGAKA